MFAQQPFPLHAYRSITGQTESSQAFEAKAEDS